MNRKKFPCQIVFIFFLTTIFTTPAWAGAPTDRIRQATDKIIEIVSDKALKEPGKKDERKMLIRKAVDEIFDWEDMSRRSLARHWAKRTGEEKKEFIDLFGQLLERTYLKKVEGYSGEKVNYTGEKIDEDYGIVNVKIVTSKDVEIPVKYRLKKKESGWLVYDISIEGVSLIKNYRVQFNNIIRRSSYKKLVKRLRAKVEKE